MSLASKAREQVRKRAQGRCEFCGVSESDIGGMLTVDHFQPRVKGGNDDLNNLIYCCAACNQYKLDYWPEAAVDPELWNPREEPISFHFLELSDGTLHPLTSKGAFTLRRLRLNRQPLVAHRQQKRSQEARDTLLARHANLIQALDRLLAQQALLMEEQQLLLEQQRALLRFLLNRLSP